MSGLLYLLNFVLLVLPLLAVSAVERIAFNSSHFMAMLPYQSVDRAGIAAAFIAAAVRLRRSREPI